MTSRLLIGARSAGAGSVAVTPQERISWRRREHEQKAERFKYWTVRQFHRRPAVWYRHVRWGMLAVPIPFRWLAYWLSRPWFQYWNHYSDTPWSVQLRMYGAMLALICGNFFVGVTAAIYKHFERKSR